MLYGTERTYRLGRTVGRRQHIYRVYELRCVCCGLRFGWVKISSMYDGRSQPLQCDVRQYVFNDFNTLQYDQVFAGTNNLSINLVVLLLD